MKWLLLIFLLISTIIVNNAQERRKGCLEGSPAPKPSTRTVLSASQAKRDVTNGPRTDLLHKYAFYLAYT